jgi:hypothetical protein
MWTWRPGGSVAGSRRAGSKYSRASVSETSSIRHGWVLCALGAVMP